MPRKENQAFCRWKIANLSKGRMLQGAGGLQEYRKGVITNNNVSVYPFCVASTCSRARPGQLSAGGGAAGAAAPPW